MMVRQASGIRSIMINSTPSGYGRGKSDSPGQGPHAGNGGGGTGTNEGYGISLQLGPANEGTQKPGILQWMLQSMHTHINDIYFPWLTDSFS